MDYNEYDSNGNKKKINIAAIISDKQKRAWLILGLYFIFIFFLIVLLRSSYSYENIEKNNKTESENKNEIIKEDEPKNIEKDNLDELDNMFSFIDQNNYNFVFTLNYNNEEYVTNGKRYNNKFDFTYSNKDQSIYFVGTTNNLKMKKDDVFLSIVFPYTYFNYFDNDIIKKIIRNSTYNETSKIYEITSKKLNEILGHSDTDDLSINTFELVTKNNKIVKINADFTKALATLDSSETNAKISLNYSDFGLIDDFNVTFE